MNTSLGTSVDVPFDGLLETPVCNSVQVANAGKLSDCEVCESIPQQAWGLGACGRCEALGQAEFRQRYYTGRALGDWRMTDDRGFGSGEVFTPCDVPVAPGQYGAGWQRYTRVCGNQKKIE